jgi:uncharacterized protein YecE (DUF72 family)
LGTKGLGGEAAEAGISNGPLDQFVRHTRVPIAIETVGSEAEHSEQEEQGHCDKCGDQQRAETAQAVGKEKEHGAGLREGVSRRPAYRSTRAEPGVRGRGRLLAGIGLCRFVTSARRSWRWAGAPPARLRIAGRGPAAGWRYWKWRDSFYAEVPQPDWFEYYLKRFDTVEINASFYSWPTVAGVQAWRRAPGKRKFVYTVKVCELITHVKKFKGTKTLIKDFGTIADILGDRMGCFLFQLPPSYRYTKCRLNDIVSQLDPSRRNVVEFRNASWWNEEVYSAFREAGILFCSCSGPRLPDELIRTADEVYARLHGPKRWYRHDYSKEELAEWADRIKTSGAKRAWIYFNNDNDAHAPKNAAALRRMLGRMSP